MQVRITKRVTEYPAPSSGWPPLDPDDPDALYMSSRLDLYRRGRELLGSAAYVCLTVLESSAAPGVKSREKRRKQTATHYRIAKDVLDKVGDLSSEKGGEVARKADGRSDEFTREETLFLEGSLKSFVREGRGEGSLSNWHPTRDHDERPSQTARINCSGVTIGSLPSKGS